MRPILALGAGSRDAARRPPFLRSARLSWLSALRGSQVLRDALDQALRARMGPIHKSASDTFSAAQPFFKMGQGLDLAASEHTIMI